MLWHFSAFLAVETYRQASAPRIASREKKRYCILKNVETLLNLAENANGSNSSRALYESRGRALELRAVPFEHLPSVQLPTSDQPAHTPASSTSCACSCSKIPLVKGLLESASQHTAPPAPSRASLAR